MGRFGNVLLVDGEPDLALTARHGEVVRFYLTNTANTRVFNVGVPGARMKLVGGDSGRYEHEEFVDEVMLAPSERAIVDVLFDQPGTLTLEHHTPDSAPTRSPTITVGRGPAAAVARRAVRGPAHATRSMVAERERLAPYLDAAPDKTLAFVAEMDMGAPERRAVVYTCPMHPEVVSDEPGRCPSCGMKLLADRRADGLRLPDAPRGRQRRARPLPGVRHEAAAGRTRRVADGRAPRPADGTQRTARSRRRPRARGGQAASSGKTTWSRSTG